MIWNHYSATLSDLDMEMIRCVPPGGNWKNIPPSIPSSRLDQIRASFARGEGSRSTYYGRLRPDAPAYTINTYFGRPGNGCHIHYEQDRVLSQREAARLQSFPDDFYFCGSRSDVGVQIGNAVPPLVAYEVARSLGEPGCFVDLFAGAGGLSLGFVWAGWTPLVANDVQPRYLETYARNVHPHVIPGNIRDPVISAAVVDAARRGVREQGGGRFMVLGGPPCQGFSTAGRRRSIHDDRNHLFRNYREILDELKPDGFVFENVMGLLNMERGRVFRDVHAILAEAVDDLVVWTIRAEEHGVPQRRARVMLVGIRGAPAPAAPEAVTAFPAEEARRSHKALTLSVQDAIDDLPALLPGEDGSHYDYRLEPSTPFQRLMRGILSPAELVLALRDAAPRHLTLLSASSRLN